MLIERLFSSPQDAALPLKRRVRGTLCALPEEWGTEAAELFADAFEAERPSHVAPLEENTLPSWLWRHQAIGKETRQETTASEVFDRAVGAATYAGWKKGLFADEAQARTFFDELRTLFTERALALSPHTLRTLGLGWAYGLQQPKAKNAQKPTPPETETLDLRNEMIDSLLRDQTSPRQPSWHKILRPASMLSVRFQDTAKEWHQEKNASAAPQLALDLLRFLRADGTFDAPAFQQSVRLATIFLDLSAPDLGTEQSAERAQGIGFVNLAALLMALGFGYATQEGRMVAASLAALMSGEALQASAELASLLGPCAAYRGEGEAKRRQLRNQFRAAHGERSDYERLSVLPPVLEITDSADLVLVALARRSWELALEAIDKSGLRILNLTAPITDPVFIGFLETAGLGILPETSLLRDAENEIGFSRTLNPAFRLGLQKAGLDPAEIKSLAELAAGTRSLAGTPGFSPEDLRQRGFDKTMIAKIEEKLQEVDKLSLVFNPWVLGEADCREKLKIASADLRKFSFDLLTALGYKADAVKKAEEVLFGAGSVHGSAVLSETQKTIFATREEIAPFAIVKMAAAIQPFIAHDLSLHLTFSASLSGQERELLLLAAWREGLWSLAVTFEGKAERTLGRLSERTGVVGKNLKANKPRLQTPMLSKARKVSGTMVQVKETQQKATRETVGLVRHSRKIASPHQRTKS